MAVIANGRAWLYKYSGPEEDLIGRYLAAALGYQADLIVRIPCDNPLVQPEYIDRAIQSYLDEPWIFYSNTTVRLNGQGYDGLGCEVLSLSLLQWLDHITKGNAILREHPHLYFKRLSSRCGHVHFNDDPSDITLDVNELPDYEFVKGIYDHCFPQNPHFGIMEILSYLDSKKVVA